MGLTIPQTISKKKKKIHTIDESTTWPCHTISVSAMETQTYQAVTANPSCSKLQTHQDAWTAATTIAAVSLVVMTLLNIGALAISVAQYGLAKVLCGLLLLDLC